MTDRYPAPGRLPKGWAAVLAGWRFAAAASVAALCLCPRASADAADLERQLQLTVTIDGQQDWRNELQWSKGTTTQRYELTTRLRTDGKLQGANLLDADLDRRMAIKQEYLKRKGLEEAKRKSGGTLEIPHTEAEKQRASAQVQEDMYKCNGDPDCMASVVQRYSAIFAQAQSDKPGTISAGAQLLDQPGRYLFYFGYEGCPNHIHAVQSTHIEGEQAFDRAHKHLVPFTLQRDADSAGNDADRKNLCRRYTAVIDTQERQLFIDNIYLPSPRGTTVLTRGDNSERQEQELPLVEELQDWLSQTLRQAKESGTASTTLHLTRPLDGNASVGGRFEGSAKVTLSWSFLPAAAGQP